GLIASLPLDCAASALRTPPAAPDLYPPALHDALPIWPATLRVPGLEVPRAPRPATIWASGRNWPEAFGPEPPDERRIDAWPLLRSEEHTSELQSRENLVCRLLLEKKKNTLRAN